MLLLFWETNYEKPWCLLGIRHGSHFNPLWKALSAVGSDAEVRMIVPYPWAMLGTAKALRHPAPPSKSVGIHEGHSMCLALPQVLGDRRERKSLHRERDRELVPTGFQTTSIGLRMGGENTFVFFWVMVKP